MLALVLHIAETMPLNSDLVSIDRFSRIGPGNHRVAADLDRINHQPPAVTPPSA